MELITIDNILTTVTTVALMLFIFRKVDQRSAYDAEESDGDISRG